MKASLSEFSMSELMELARRAKDKVVLVKMDTPFLRVIFEGGEPVFAIYRNLKGGEAFLASMFVDDGEVVITPIATQARIKKNLDATFEQLLSKFTQKEEAYLEARSLVDSLDRTVEPRLVLDKEQTLRIGKKEWNVLVALLKGMSLREAATDSGTAEYVVIETISTFLKLGALSLGQHKPKEDQQVIQSQIVSSLVDVAAEVGDRPLRADAVAANEDLIRQETAQSESHEIERPKSLVVTDTQIDEEHFELRVSMFPIIADFLDNTEIDDQTIAINTNLFRDLSAQCGHSFTRCKVSNIDDSGADSLVMKVYVHDAVEEAALSTAALFKLKVWSGSKVRVTPLFEQVD